MNPALYTAGTTFDATSKNIFNKLVEFERGTTKIVPGLAESWELSPDGLTYTFHLRKGVKFHTLKDFKPTRDFNADDVVHTVEMVLGNENLSAREAASIRGQVSGEQDGVGVEGGGGHDDVCHGVWGGVVVLGVEHRVVLARAVNR